MAMEQNLKCKDIGLKEILHFGFFQKNNKTCYPKVPLKLIKETSGFILKVKKKF